MICSYCGASFGKKERKCPNCHSENPLMTEKRKQQVRNAIDRRAIEDANALPEKKVKKAHTMLVIVLAGILVFCVLGCLLGYAVVKQKAKVEYEVYLYNIEKLEQYIDANDWEGFEEFYHNHDCWNSKYTKYTQIIEAKTYGTDEIRFYCNEYQRMLAGAGLQVTEKEWYYNEAKDILRCCFSSYAEFCAENKKRVNDRVVLGNERLFKQWEEEITDYLRDMLLMTEEELNLLRTGMDQEEVEGVIEKYIERDRK